MDLGPLSEALARDALWVVFANVLVQQLGFPVPAVPTLLVAGSLAATPSAAGKLLAAAIVASLLADWVWYGAGRAYGYRVLARLCKLSLNPASCVSQTEARFSRWGVWSLIVAKFVPGFSTVAPPIAGALRLPLPAFLLAAGSGAALWAGAALAAGWLLRGELPRLLDRLSGHADLVLVALLAALALWLAGKRWQQYRFARAAAIPHIAADELVAAMASATPPLLIDLRKPSLIAEAGPITGATVADHEHLAAAVGAWPRQAPIVTLCACPEDAGAVQAASTLRKLGYTSVRPLKGGFSAWRAAQAAISSLPDAR